MNKISLHALSRPSEMQHRGKRCGSKGRNYVRQEVEQRSFSKDQDDLILKLHALLGNRWSLIAGRLPGRTDNEVRIHWETYLKWKLIKMGIDPTNHRLHHHTNYMSRRYLKSSHMKHETKFVSDQASSVSKSCGVTVTNYSEDSTSTGQSRLPDLNIGLIPTVTSSESSNDDSTGSPWIVLSRSFLEYCIFSWDNLPRILLMYFNNVILSEECYFHTVICNAPEFSNTCWRCWANLQT